MPASPDETARKARQWAAYAEEDILLARHGLALGCECPCRLVAYHAQQCVEKYLKSFLILSWIDFPYTHNIARLLELCETRPDWSETLADAETLTPFATTLRYPGEESEVSIDEAEEAVTVAEHIREVVRKALADSGLDL